MLVSAISYLNRNTNLGVENNSSKQQSAKSKATENFGHVKENQVEYKNSSVVKNIIASASSVFSKDKSETNSSRCLSIIG